MKNKLFKPLGLTFICGVFIFLAFGSGESSIKSLKDTTKEEIIKALTDKEFTDNYDESAGTGLLTYKISLQMSKNGTFKYSMVEEKDNGSYKNSINATGTYEFIGEVEETFSSGGTDKYGQVANERPTYTQKIRFTGKTNTGRSFALNADLTHFTDQYGGLENYWFFSHQDKAISMSMNTSLSNFRLPTDKIYP
jgi:hypothetical protein